jgi:hypothetical protein
VCYLQPLAYIIFLVISLDLKVVPQFCNKNSLLYCIIFILLYLERPRRSKVAAMLKFSRKLQGLAIRLIKRLEVSLSKP